MLTAGEARALQNSFIGVSQICNKMGEGIRNSIEKSNGAIVEYFYDMGACEYEPEQLSLQNELLKKLLQSHGYSVSYQEYGEAYVPRGLSDDYGDGPSYRNYGFVITWGKE